MSESGLPGLRGEGNTKSLLSWWFLAWFNTSRAVSLSGTRCSLAIFIFSAGIRHSRALKSISSHTALRASPERAAVSTVNRRHSLADGDARDSSTKASASATSA